LLAPAGGPSALAVPTAAFGADAHGRRRLRLAFCHPSPPVWDAVLSGPCWYGWWNQCLAYPWVFWEYPSLCFVLLLVFLVCSIIWSHELRRRGKVRLGRYPRCPGKAIVRTGGRHVPEHTVWDCALEPSHKFLSRVVSYYFSHKFPIVPMAAI